MGNERDDRDRGQGWRDSNEQASYRGGGQGGRSWNQGGREERGWGSGGGGRGDDRGSGGGRGFMERAGEEVRSWFGGDDDDRGQGRGGYGSQGSRDHGNEWGSGNRERGQSGGSGGGGGDERYGDFRSSSGGGGSGPEIFGTAGGDDNSRFRGAYGGGGTSGFGGGPDHGRRFDRVDPGHVGSQGAHPMSAPVGGGYGSDYGIGPGGGVGSSARYARMAGQGGQQHHIDTAKLLGDEPRGGQQHQPQGRQQQGQGFAGFGGGGQHDPHYSQWRQRQVEELDRDYDDYCREHQSRFEQEFGSWREKRQGQRQSLGKVTEHMKVVGSDGSPVGTVDKVAGDRIILTKSDENAGGRHHAIPCGWIDSVDDQIRLNKSAEEATRQWQDAEDGGAMFGGGRSEPDLGSRTIEDQGGGDPHMLNRSFSNTYDREGDR